MELSSLFETCFIIFVLMLIGFFGARRGIFPAGFSRAVSSLLVNCFLMATVFQSICGGAADVSAGQLPHLLLMVTVMNAVCYALGWLTARLFGRRLSAGAPLELSIGVMNNLLIGLPILQAIYGPTAVLYAGLTSLPFNLMLYIYGVWRLNAGRRAGHVRVKQIFSPMVIATLLALAVFSLRIPVPGFMNKLLTTMAAVSMPLSMVVIGITMGSEDLREALRDKRVYLVCLVRLVFAPALTWLALHFLTDNALLLKSCVVIAGCPTGIVVPILSLQYDHDPTLASNSVMVSTLLALITLPVLLLILG